MSSLFQCMTPAARQTWVSLLLLFNKLGAGMNLGFTSCFLKAIKEPDSDIQMDIHISTWFVSSVAISLPIGHIFAAITIPRLGRRRAGIICTLPAITGQIITCLSRDNSTLIICRALVGIGFGSNSLIGGVVVGEYVDPKNRGTFFNMATASLNVGSLFMHILGNFLPWRTLAIINSVPYILCLVFAYTSPESPFWLAEKKQYEKSREAFYLLRGKTEESTKEIEQLIRSQRQKTISESFSKSVRNVFLKFKKRNFLLPLCICIVATLLMESSGRHIFPSYAGQLMSEIMPNVNIYYYNIVLDILIILSGFSASYLIRVIKTRTLLLSTGSATAVVLILACVSLYLVKNGFIAEEYSLMSLIFFALFVILGSSGCTCVPLALGGELIPLEHKAVGSLLYFLSAGILMFVPLQIMPYMVATFYIYGAFMVLAVCMIVVLVILYYILPETSNKTLQEIEQYFEDGKRRDVNVDCADEEQSLDTLNVDNKVY